MEKFKNTQTIHSLLTTHVNLAKEISDLQATRKSAQSEILEIEDGIMSGRIRNSTDIFARLSKMIDKGEKLEHVLKLGTLSGIITGNFFDKKMNKQILESYGLDKIEILENLQVILSKNSKNFWKIKDLFDLVPEQTDDLAESYAGYVPLSVRLVQDLAKWRQQTERLNLLHGPVLEISQGSPLLEGETLVVCFVGGATFSEVNALRTLAKKQQKKIFVVTTEMLSAKSFFDSLAE